MSSTLVDVKIDSEADLTIRCLIRPFLYSAPGKPSQAYELCLVRCLGDKVYDRRIAILSGTDAADIALACPSIPFQRCS